MKAFIACSYLACIAHAAMKIEEVSDKITQAEYAVRGEIVLMAQDIQAELDSGKHNYPFEKLIPCNIGNPQAVGQKPVTFHRQVLSGLTNPEAIDEVEKIYHPDVISRARQYSNKTKFGAYSHSKGINLFREKIADYIHRRDNGVGAKPDIENIYISNGASPVIQMVLEMMIRDAKDVILIPIPQYPLYSATVTRLGGTWRGYELKEDYSASKPAWGLDLDVMAKVYDEEVQKGNRVRGVAVINPGNPTGNILTRGELEKLVEFAETRGITILADEVYQENIFTAEKPFVSVREVVLSKKSKVELYSFHSISKGYYGECGLRGGYMELNNVAKEINEELYKLSSMTLCSNTLAQAMVASIVNPPQPGDASYDLFDKERSSILGGLKRKAKLVHEEINKIKGFNAMPIEGAMYAFPQVQLPTKYIEHAKSLGVLPDTQYCKDLLKALGVIMVPGNGFGQRANTFHFRMTILPQEEDLVRMLKGLKTFQDKMYAEYGEPAHQEL